MSNHLMMPFDVFGTILATQPLSPAARGCMFTLYLRSWRADGPLALADDEAARTVGLTVYRWRKIKNELARGGFLKIVDGELHCCMMEQLTTVPERTQLDRYTRKRVYERDGQVCFYCAAIDGRMVIDHKIPVIRGGSNYDDNLVVCCASCNSRKGSKTAEEFIEWLSNIPS